MRFQNGSNKVAIELRVVQLPLLIKLLVFSTKSLLMSSSSYFFFAARKWNDRQTVDESNSIKFETTFVGDHTRYLILTE